MRYRNIKTGIEFETNCIISGSDFEPVGKKTAPKEEKTEVQAEKPKTTTKRTKK